MLLVAIHPAVRATAVVLGLFAIGFGLTSAWTAKERPRPRSGVVSLYLGGIAYLMLGVGMVLSGLLGPASLAAIGLFACAGIIIIRLPVVLLLQRRDEDVP